MPYIKTGRKNAIHLQELSDILHTSVTTIKKSVREARKRGIPIISCIDGYYLAEDREDEINFVRKFHRQTITRFSTIKTIRKDLRENPNQLTFADMEMVKNE